MALDARNFHGWTIVGCSIIPNTRCQLDVIDFRPEGERNISAHLGWLCFLKPKELSIRITGRPVILSASMSGLNNEICEILTDGGEIIKIVSQTIDFVAW